MKDLRSSDCLPTTPPSDSFPASPDDRGTATNGLFQVHVGGLLEVVSRHLYSQGPEVFVRELLQNAVDAIAFHASSDAGFRGLIVIEVVAGDDGRSTVVVEDDGIGLTWDEALPCLATIGYSSKRTEAARAGGVIGQFGIGLLSGFMVADEIRVVSKSHRAGEEAFLWTGRVDGEWRRDWLGSEVTQGTKVYLHLRPAESARFSAKEIARLARRFGRFLRVPVELRAEGMTETITEAEAPWDSTKEKSEAVFLKAGERITGIRFAGAFAFSDAATDTVGVAFIEPEAVSPGADPGHWLYVRRMLVGEKVRGLAPAHLPFLRLVMNSSGLRVNAAREGLHGEETRLDGIHAAVAEALDRYLDGLTERDPARARDFVFTQSENLLRAVEENGQFLGLLRRHYPVETSVGMITAEEALRRYRRIEYVSRDEDFLKIEVKARQEGVCVARGSYRQSSQLLHALERVLPPEVIRLVGVAEFLGRFATPVDTSTERERRIAELVTEELKTENCVGGFYDGEDPDEPAILNLDDRESIDRLLGRDFRNQLWGESETPAGKTLQLNRSHDTVAAWLNGAQSADPIMRCWIRVFYHFALLSGREVPTAGELRRFSRAVEMLSGCRQSSQR